MLPNHKNPRVYGDTTECSHCGKQWDTNDPEPPPCKQASDWCNEMRQKLKESKPNE